MYMHKIALITFLFAGVAAKAQKTQKIADPKSFASSITADDLKKHLHIVAGAGMEGRETATEGQRKAAAYIENHFRSLGLQPGNKSNFQLSYPIYQDSIISTSIEVNGQQFNLNTDFSINVILSHNSTILCNEVVYVGNGVVDSSRNDYADVNVQGKIVLIVPRFPTAARGSNSGESNIKTRPLATIETAQRNGAAAVLIVQNNFPRITVTKTGLYLNGFQKSVYPITYTISENIARAIMGNDYDAAKEAIKNGNHQPKTYEAEVKLECQKSMGGLSSSNVIGYVEGTDLKDQYLFITAHYDHLGKRDTVTYYGADDDGSGTVSVLELAEAFAKAKAAGKGPRRTVVFMAVSGEEKGLWGSQYYSNHPLFPLERTTADLNIDMIGRIDPKRTQGDSNNYVYVVGDDKLSSDLHPINEKMNKKYTRLELDYKYNDPKDQERIYYRSDHYNFARKGVPIIFYFNGTHKDYHRPTDTPDKINYQLMAKRTQLIFYTAWEMANRNDMLKRDLPIENK